MGLKILVTVKQVPDTHNVSGNAMKPDGTINRAALKAIFNPMDLNALEEAIRLKEKVGGHITCISMGPAKAQDVLKECLYRGADEVILLSDAKFAGADTLATSYALSCAIKKVGIPDVIFCGKQAIDGDTAQVGPQIAANLGINQLCHISSVENITNKDITVIRSTQWGQERLKSKYPVLLTISSECNTPRYASAKKLLAYKYISLGASASYMDGEQATPEIQMHVWNAQDINADPKYCGLSGSPTKVKEIESVTIKASESKKIEATDEGISSLIHELIAEHITG